ncbi:MAG: polysaccharide deacetylase family protein [Paenibacillus sp.]|uniref:polysaccharide deacetylase family protein n=1 Tax=Paenibacillus sp. TaxID=58172 RepID=UPI0025D22AAF|nr:polysaccharide deacetylase family protein [Paenibacillus sp.]MBR2565167.1 polysaccharide deacetylase family protein [Paenibacillus sp.]
MEPYVTQVIELLSFGKTPDGVNQIEVLVIQEDTQSTYKVDIDEFTYHGFEALKPLDGERIRLSLYSKWDPYRKSYYSSITRTTGVSRDVHYFPCSEAYINELNRIRNLPPVVVENRGQKVEIEEPAQEHTQLLKQLSTHLPKICVLFLTTVSLLIVLSITSKGENDSVHTFGESIGVALAEEEAVDLKERIVPTSSSASYKMGISDPASKIEQANLSLISNQPNQNQTYHKIIDIDEEKPLYGLPGGYVALTFDDGPSPFTKQFVDILTEKKVAATFLFVGKKVKGNPDAVIYAIENGMAIGNHSWDHSVIPKSTPENQRKNLLKTNSVLESLTDTAVTLFRPPYGAVNNELLSEVQKLNMKTLLWNRDPEDWHAKKPEDIMRYFHQVEAAGGIYVLHENKNTLEALPDIINYLQEKNLTFVTFQ